MLGVLANAGGALLGAILGLIFKKGVPEKVNAAIMGALGLFSIVVGVMGVFDGENTPVLLVSLVVGTLIGTLLNIDGAAERLGKRVESRFSVKDGQVGIAQGFVASSLLYCVGAMGIVGAIQAGTTGNAALLYTKAVLDFVAGMMLAVSLGAGVALASASILVFEGAIVLLAHALEPILSSTMINEMSCVGSLIIIGLGFNFIGLTKFKIADFLPAIVLAPFVSLLFAALGVG